MQRPRLQVTRGVNRHGDGPVSVRRMGHDMMAANDSVDDESQSLEDPDHAPATHGRQALAGHLTRLW
jgi:hypothetical protein